MTPDQGSSKRHTNGGQTGREFSSIGCLHPPFSGQLKGVYVGLAVASAPSPLRTLRDLDPSTFLLLKGAADTWSQLGVRVGAEGLSSLFSLIASFTADYSPLTQTASPHPGKVPLPPRGASWGPQGWGRVELVNGHPLSADCVEALGHPCLRATTEESRSEGAPWRSLPAWAHSPYTPGSWGSS